MSCRWPEDLDSWVGTFRDRLDDNATFSEHSAGWGVSFDGDILLTIESDEHLPEGPMHLVLELEDGDCLGARRVEDPDSVAFGVSIAGTYADWERLLTGEEDVARIMTQGPFDVDGPKLKLLSYRSALAELVETARRTDVTFTRLNRTPGAR
ncbi:SCP2 sterol-binding domain-containing protein [Halococcoides cellulosivorans]|uniref:SCP2 sterol-binding domain-containing protein n=1 Tax=Halococcoides cellulosivorans TaxID=1679096 RepID=UPI00131ED393|nr:hypothetical protein [Halococcoides cellulosivorans]